MRKKLFAVIMSAMMMITFMPSMAFAAEPVNASLTNIKFNSDFTAASAKLVQMGSTEEITTTSVAKTFQADGSIQAVADFTAKLAGFNITSGTAADGWSGSYANMKYTDSYYDLTGATIVGYSKSIDSDEYLYCVDELDLQKMLAPNSDYSWNTTDQVNLLSYDTKFDYNPLGDSIHFVRPAAVTAGPTSADASADSFLTGSKKLSIKVKPSSYAAYDADGDYSFPVEIKKANNSIKYVVGSVNTTQKLNIYTPANSDLEHVKWNIGGKYVDSDDAFFETQNWGYLDDDTLTAYDDLEINSEYVAADQKFEVSAKNIKVEYGVYDKTEGDYVYSTTAPTMKNVKHEDDYAFGDVVPYEFKLKLTKGSLVKTCDVKIKITPVFSSFGFKQNAFIFGVGEDVKTSDLVALKTLPGMSIMVSDEEPNLAMKDAYEADKANIAKYINKYIEVNGLFEGLGTNTIQLGIDPWAMSTIELSMIEDMKENPEIFATMSNYSINSGSMYDASASATLTRTNKANDITATKQTKTYHIKKAAKLKSTKTFQCKASADYGKLTFTKLSGNSKIKVAANGKVTVKKGLKKGTYKVKVKVKAPNAKATKYVYVKIKK